MGRFAERSRGVELHLLDRDKMTERLLAIVSLQHGADAAELPYRAASNLAIVRDTTASTLAERQFIVICTEGVSRKPDERGLVAIDLERDFMFATYGRISVGLLWDEMRSGRTVDLADHVRSFGDRLEDNFWLHHRLLTEQQATV
jgi:hypothetical protein